MIASLFSRKAALSGLLSFCRPVAALCAGASVLLAGFSATAANAQVKQLYVRGQLQHINGVNLPWMRNSGGSNYGHDIGPNHFTGYGYHYVGSDVDSYYADIKNMHANVVRVWLFENLQGLNFDGNGYISGIDGTFLNNLTDMVQRANNHGLALELMLLGNDVGVQAGHAPHDGGGNFRNPLTDSSAQSAFMNNVVKVLAQRFNNNYGVYGYDLMNEANYAVSTNTNPCSWGQMHSFIYNGAQAIHNVNNNTQVTCSTDDSASLQSGNFYNRFGGVGLNYFDFHQYSDNPTLPTLGSGGTFSNIDRPVVLAEYGPSSTGNISLQTNVTDSFINQASYKNWAGALIWDYDPTGQDVLAINYGVGSWHPCCNTLQWYSINKFGL